ncbi:MAG: hypothetical protein ACOCV3_00115 [Halanaerobiales bacterium]
MMQKSGSILAVGIISLVLVFAISGISGAESADPEDVDLALVDSYQIQEETDDEIMADDIADAVKELDFDLTVDIYVLEAYLEDNLEAVNNLRFEDITEDVEEVIEDEDEVDKIEEMDGVEDITDEVLEEIND